MDAPSLLGLPTEILQQIVTDPSLSLQDVCRISLTCERLHRIVSNSWSLIANSRWSWWEGCTENSNDEWYTLCRQRHMCESKLDNLLQVTIKKGVRLYLIDDDDMEDYEKLIGNEGCTSKEVMDCVLKEILNKPIKNANLSYQYYCLGLYEYLQREQLKEKWRALLDQPPSDQLLIQAGILIAQWIDPVTNISEETINNELDDIASEVAKIILKQDISETKCPKYDKKNTIAAVRSLSISRQAILEGINKVLFTQLGFKGSTDDYYKVENSLINHVLQRKKGIPITLSAIYQAVASRLGVTLFPVNFPGHFLLKAPQDLQSKEGEVFVDAYNKGELLNQQQCLNLVPFLITPQPDMFNAVEPHKAMIRMIANIYSRGQQMLGINFDVARQWKEDKQCWGPLVLPAALALQLTLCWLSPTSDFTRQVASDAANIALDLRFNTKQVIWVMSDMLVQGSSLHVLTNLQRAQTMAERKKRALGEPTRVKERDPQKVWFAIGMIMKHRRYNYHCVIYGWDTQCEMSESWIEQMGVRHLPLGPDQPFYNVLVEDGTNRYAAQENLFHCPAEELSPIRHWEVGKYFQAYTGSRYVPNHALLEKYPQIE